ncbi:beta-1,4-glucuronyltransferase 1-like [Sitophilus oryzae]|uniref:Beta-1,4-glucuronyltransferase 1-like n=1 Tax=Sitophilus oryzae TaxID=7048 RepID=A0A6J2YMV7_SITOR|nr:beta-1,4-glucuronyltransferase 1-like [Sitophilus oryzae]
MTPKARLNLFLGIVVVFLFFYIYDRSRPFNSVGNYSYINRELDILTDPFTCNNIPERKYLEQRGLYYVLFNFVVAQRNFGCSETITLTAPGDFQFLENLVPLIRVWQGAVSIGVYAPGNDFHMALASIAYLRNCEETLIKELVSFHLIFDVDHVPNSQNNTPLIDSYIDHYDCSIPPPWETIKQEDTYRRQNKLFYPLNVARNVAKSAARTYVLFPSDMELFPPRNFVGNFLQFAKENLKLFQENSKSVFVLPIFEIEEGQTIPENKTTLQEMLKNGKAIVFHKNICLECHKVIDGDKWIEAAETEGLNLFSVGKRQGAYQYWEPFFLSTQKEQFWDERFVWEGQRDKHVHVYAFCLMDYDFVVLDNAFLVHKPGIKKVKVQDEKYSDQVKKTKQIMKGIETELQNIYGYNKKCIL